jgi:hypothetical protein
MKALLHALLLLPLSVLVSAACAAEPLRHDPFARPPLAQQGARGSGTNAGSAMPDDAPWTPKLLGILVAGKRSLVNVDGTLVGVGEVVDGYRLERVRDGEATFRKGRKRVVLQVEMAGPREFKERGRP